MIFVTLTLNDNEWERLLRLMPALWPTFRVYYNISRNELTRTLLMSGLSLLTVLSEDRQRDVATPNMRVLQPPADTVMPVLPGAPKSNPHSSPARH